MGEGSGLRGPSLIGRTWSIEATEVRERYWRFKEYFYRRVEDLGLQGDESILLVMSNIDGIRRLGGGAAILYKGILSVEARSDESKREVD